MKGTLERHQLLLGCGAGLAGLAVSTGRPLGIAVAVVLPALALRAESRRKSYQTAALYYGAALWPLVPGANNFFGPQVSVLLAIVLWITSAALLALPWPLVWSADAMQSLWRAPAGILLGVVPPLGIIGWASPVLAAGILFPAMGWCGLLCCTVATGTLAVWPRCTTVAVIGVATIANLAHPTNPQPPPGWVAVHTEFGSIAHYTPSSLMEYQAALQIQAEARSRRAAVIIFPETVVPYWTTATDAFWEETLDFLRGRGETIIVGARIPLRGSAVIPISDFFASLAVLRGDLLHASSSSLSGSANEPIWHPRYLNTMVVRGADVAIVPQRVPVPIAMWNPFRADSARSDWLGSGTVQIRSERAGIVVCYEQLIAWPLLITMTKHPTVLIAPANDYWAKGTSIPMFQRTAMTSWARLFALPCLFAVNT
jgi:apolipoprotein N-acyltransferase